MKVILAIIVLSTLLCPLGGIASSIYYKRFKSKKTDMPPGDVETIEDKLYSIFQSSYAVIAPGPSRDRPR